MRRTGPEALLLLAAAIWGLAFVAQREGMLYLDPLLFNGIRFTLGAFVVGIFAVLRKDKTSRISFPWLLSAVLFIASTLQQVGIVFTTAGSAGFITGLYVVFVPLLGLFRRQRITPVILAAVGLSVAGLCFINAGQEIKASLGNLLVLLSAVFWAWHVQLVDIHTRRHATLQLAFCQFAFVALASLAGGVIYNLLANPGLFSLRAETCPVGSALLPLLYSGLLSVGIAYTLQIHAQKKVPPVPATLILCLEGVFALLGGWLILSERLTANILTGSALMLTAMLISVMANFKSGKQVKA